MISLCYEVFSNGKSNKDFNCYMWGLYVTRFLHYFIKLGNDHLTFRGRLCFFFCRQILHAKKNKMN